MPRDLGLVSECHCHCLSGPVSPCFATEISYVPDVSRKSDREGADADVWAGQVARMWRPAFTTTVLTALTRCLAAPSSATTDHFSRLAQDALAESGCDLEVLGQAFWVEEFLALLPRLLLQGMRTAALQDPTVDRLVRQLLAQRADDQASGPEPATPSEFRADLIALADGLIAQARADRLPKYIPHGTDLGALTRTVRVRAGLRARDTDIYKPQSNIRYGLAAEQAPEVGVSLSWLEMAARCRRLVVLGDPGLGKSWLIRAEALRLAQAARAAVESRLGIAVPVPLPLRCDQLDAAEGGDLADKVTRHFATQGLLASRSQNRLAEKIRGGEAVLLLDAADELTPEAAGRVRQLLGRWSDLAGSAGRCVVTSRVAGYTGSFLEGAVEVELQPFSEPDVAALVDAWPLSPVARAQLNQRLRDPAVGAMARIPLMLALLCSLAAQDPCGHALPQTRGQLYERVMRWFLTGAHRSPESSAAVIRSDVTVEAMLEILAPLAFTFATSSQGWIDLMHVDQLLSAIRTAGPAFTEQERPAPAILQELSADAGILIPAGDPSSGRAPGYLFLHRTFAEFLVGRHLASLPQREWLAIVDEHRWFDPDWAEVIPMLAEQLTPPSATTLVQHLMEEATDPFHHSLLTAARAWGARPDADQILPTPQAADLARRITQIMGISSTVVSDLTSMTYLPRSLLSALLDRLAVGDQVIRRRAALALARQDSPEISRALIRQLADDNPEIRIAAIIALADRDSPEVIAALLDRLTDENLQVRSQAIRALADRDTPEITRALLDRLADDQWEVRFSAATTLAGHDAPELTCALLDRLADDNPEIRIAAIMALADRDSPEVIAALLDRLTDENLQVRSQAVRALADRDTPEITRALVERLADDIMDIRWEAASALADRDTPELTHALLDRLADDNPHVQIGAAFGLGSRRLPETRTTLLDRLVDDNPDIRWEAAEALVDRDLDSLEVTTACLDRLNDEAVRYTVVHVLEQRHSPIATMSLVNLLVNDDPTMRTAAAWALGGRESPAGG
jgi:HEAT repeat protein